MYCQYRGISSGEEISSMHSNPLYSTRTSISSRRGSSVSVLSERRSSNQYGRRCSDASTAALDSSNNHSLTRRVHFCTPIHEQNKETIEHNTTGLSDNVTQLSRSTAEAKNTTSTLYVELFDKPNTFIYQITEV